MDLGLVSKVFIVTGGARGIGEAIIRALCREGAIAIVADKEVEKSWDLVQELRDEGSEIDAVIGELAEAENCRKIVAFTLNKYGRIDGLVNNAGRNDQIGLEHGSPDEFMNSIRSNLLHYYSMAYFALDALKKSEGNIVNISSKTAITGQGNTSAYAAGKGGQLALTREWAVELSKYGIRVNAIVPAEVMTPLYREWIGTFERPEEKLQHINEKIPLGNRMTKAEEIAHMAIFLLSNKSTHITGQHIFVDGGYVHLDRAMNVLSNGKVKT